MARKPLPQKYPGRGKERINVRACVLAAFDHLGAVQWLVKLAESPKHRHLFVQLLVKTIPQELVGKDGGPIEMHVLHIAKDGIARLSDDRLALLWDLLCEIGVNDIVVGSGSTASGNGDEAVPMPDGLRALPDEPAAPEAAA